MEWRGAWAAALRGDFTEAHRLSSAPARDDAALAWHAALSALYFSAVPSGTPPSRDQLSRFVNATPEARVAATLAGFEGLRWSVLAFAREEVRAWSSLLVRLAPEDSEAKLWTECARLWSAVSEGRFDEVARAAQLLESDASNLGVPNLVVEAAALRALALAVEGDLVEGTRVARRASRMARTESIPQAEYLAHLILARVRRLLGSPHLATRILRGLFRVAPRQWHGWLRWEAVMSGALELASERAADPAALLFDWYSALEGERERLPAATRALGVLEVWPLLSRDAAPLLEAVRLDRAPEGSVAAWSRGESSRAPAELHGMLSRRGVAPEGGSAVAYVLAAGDLRRRIPRVALALIDRDRVELLPQSRLKQGRTEMLACALALAPEGIAEAACFESVYGFPFEPELHKGVFDVLVHRTREYFGDRGTITRSGGQIRLTLARSILLADPRCTRPLGDSLLGILAHHEGASAKDVAKASGVSLRVVQATLQGLVQEGMCQVDKSGREVRYLVEDTTFSEPTGRMKFRTD